VHLVWWIAPLQLLLEIVFRVVISTTFALLGLRFQKKRLWERLKLEGVAAHTTRKGWSLECSNDCIFERDWRRHFPKKSLRAANFGHEHYCPIVISPKFLFHRIWWPSKLTMMTIFSYLCTGWRYLENSFSFAGNQQLRFTPQIQMQDSEIFRGEIMNRQSE